MSLNKRADAFKHLFHFAEASRDCQEVLDRFGSATSSVMTRQLTRARTLLSEMGSSTNTMTGQPPPAPRATTP